MSRFTLEYLTRFKCIAERCEDTCCAGLDINVSAQDRDTLVKTLEGQPEQLAKIVELAEPAGAHRFTLLRNEHGACSFLQPDMLCSVMKVHGQKVMPDACALFPRNFNISADRVEMVATLGCPEAARLCLLHEGSTERVPAPDETSERWPALAAKYQREPYSAMFDDVHPAVLEILRDRSMPVRTRLMQLAELAEAVTPFFHRGSAPADAQVLQALVEGRSPGARLKAASDLEGEGIDGQPALQTAMWILNGLLGRKDPRAGVRFPTLAQAVLREYQLALFALAPNLGEPDGPALGPLLWQVFSQRRARLWSAFGPFLEKGLERYWVNDWFRDPYTTSPSLASRAFGMLLKGAILNFLLVGHPVIFQLVAVREARELEPAEQSLLEQAFVETVQIFVKHIERRDLLGPLDEQLTPEKLGVDAITRARLFASAA